MTQSPPVRIRSHDLDAAEFAWFAALCDDDYAQLGVVDPALRSTWVHCRDIVLTAEKYGFNNILCPSSYQIGQDTLSFVAACAPLTKTMALLAAIRCGELHPIMLARTIATLDHMLQGRLTLNIISSDFPGETANSTHRYQRSREVIQILHQAWAKDTITHHGLLYDFAALDAAPAKPYQINGGPLLYFGGYSPAALDLCAEYCDVYLMWPEPRPKLAERMRAVAERAEQHGRVLDYGLRVHMIVRDSEIEARDYAEHLVAGLDDNAGDAIRTRALDAGSHGVSYQTAARADADAFGYIEPHLWTGIGRARSGCGAALVGSVDQVLSAIEAYQKMGIRAFIFSGYPHMDECCIFGEKVMPQVRTCSLPHVYDRIPQTTPNTALAGAF